MTGPAQSQPNRCNVLVFDLDDTLYPECDFVQSGFLAVDEWLREHKSLPGFALAAQTQFTAGARGNIFDLALKKLGAPFEPELITELVQIYRSHQPRLQLHPDAAWALDHFRPRMKLAILTDGYLVTQQNKVAALGLQSRVDSIIYSDEFGREHWKPAETPFRKLVDSLQCDHLECVYVADNPEKDFVAPLALGWRTIQVVRPSGEYCRRAPHPAGQPAQQIQSLYELRDLL